MNLNPVDDPAAYEGAVLDSVREVLAGDAVMIERFHRSVRGVRLDGSCPETKIVVDYLDLRTGAERNKVFDLWGESFAASDGGRDHPGTVGTIVAANLTTPID